MARDTVTPDTVPFGTTVTTAPTHTLLTGQLRSPFIPQGKIKVNRGSGPGPLAVHFDATDMKPAAVTLNDWIYNYEFRWNFGDPGQGNWNYGGTATRTAVADAVWGSPTGDTVTITSAGANLPSISAGEVFRVLSHSDAANNGFYQESGGSPTTSSVTATKIDGTPQAAGSEAVEVFTALGEDKNLAYGPIAGHVFDPTPGTGNQNYNVTLTIRAPDGAVFTITTGILVYDADVWYSASNPVGLTAETVVMSITQDSVSGSWTGEPAGARRIGPDGTGGSGPVASWATLKAELEGASNKRVLLRKGEDWNSGANLVTARINIAGSRIGSLLGSFGSGDNPLIHVNQTSNNFTCIRGNLGQWVIRDINWEDDQTNTSIWWAESPFGSERRRGELIRNTLVLGCRWENFNQIGECSPGHQTLYADGYQGEMHHDVFWVENINKWTSNTQTLKRQGCWLVGYDRACWLGNSLQHQLAPAHFNVRHMFARKVVFSNNRIWGNPDTNQASCRWHAPLHNQPGWDPLYTEFNIISGNEWDLASGGSTITFGQLNDWHQEFRCNIIERNFITGTDPSNTGDNSVEIRGGNYSAAEDNVHVRQNVMTRDGAGASLVRLFKQNRNTLGVNKVRIYHNVFYTPDTFSPPTWAPISVDNLAQATRTVTVHSNVCNAPNYSGTLSILDQGGLANSNFDESNNVFDQLAESTWFVGPTPYDVPSKFEPTTGPDALSIDAGRLTSTAMYQFDGVTRNDPSTSYDGAPDCGSWEDSV